MRGHDWQYKIFKEKCYIVCSECGAEGGVAETEELARTRIQQLKKIDLSKLNLGPNRLRRLAKQAKRKLNASRQSGNGSQSP